MKPQYAGIVRSENLVKFRAESEIQPKIFPKILRFFVPFTSPHPTPPHPTPPYRSTRKRLHAERLENWPWVIMTRILTISDWSTSYITRRFWLRSLLTHQICTWSLSSSCSLPCKEYTGEQNSSRRPLDSPFLSLHTSLNASWNI